MTGGEHAMLLTHSDIFSGKIKNCTLFFLDVTSQTANDLHHIAARERTGDMRCFDASDVCIGRIKHIFRDYSEDTG